jgi:multidrug efflux pump subunit AcrB
VTRIGPAGKIAHFFIDSKLTPLIVLASILLGLFAVVQTPREEEPQISVPMIDVYVSYPGASSKEVEQRVTTPVEKYISEIPGVEYVYSISRPGMSVFIVRYLVGQNMEQSLVKLYDKLNAHMDQIPPGVYPPLIKPRSIDDVPILSLTLWGKNYDDYTLRRVALELDDQIKQVNDVAQTQVIGGQNRQFRILLNPNRLAAYHLSPISILPQIQQANVNSAQSQIESANQEIKVQTGSFITNIDDLRKLVVSTYNQKPVFLGDIAEITDGPEEPIHYVFIGVGPQSAKKGIAVSTSTQHDYPAVTISIAKRKGTNATRVAESILKKIEGLKGSLVPSDVQITVTRNYGETAQEKSNELLEHMLIATFSVIILMALALGWRDSLVVAVAIPVTLSLTLFIYYILGYTLNRVTLFALIFSIGILVDDAIVVVENIHRYFASKTGLSGLETAVSAVDEVGNPTILATFTVIAAILPMGFVSGLMGPYMRPIPIGASMAMLFSLFIAFVISPYMAYRLLKKKSQQHNPASVDRTKTWDYRFYVRIMNPLIRKPLIRLMFLIGVIILLLGSMSLVYFKVVKVKMLPFDNKSEFQVIVDLPEGTTLEQTYRVTQDLSDYLRTVPEVTDYEAYVGTASPVNFNGLVRHYFLRQESNQADIQVNLVNKKYRNQQSHDIAKRVRPALDAIGKKYGARIKVGEIPPGPPVLQTLVAEIYGPDYRQQIALAKTIKGIFDATSGVVDVDWEMEDDQQKIQFEVDKEKAALNGISTDQIAQTVYTAINGYSAGLSHLPKEKEPVNLVVRFPHPARSDITQLQSIYVANQSGQLIPVSELVTVHQTIEDKSIYHKNLKPVVYVTGDVAGTEESPIYAIQKLSRSINQLNLPPGYKVEQYMTHAPFINTKLAMKWDGEWQITYEVFRDLGLAFAIVLILIYFLVVAWFQSFTTPLVIMAPIPLTLIGILPGHALFGAFFTATSMIGFIALAGIIVRNSIILIDFVEIRRREGFTLEDAIIDAGAVRFRPMLLTAAAVVVGGFVILFDPIFQGLAIALMSGEIASTFLSRITIPILYYLSESRKPGFQPFNIGIRKLKSIIQYLQTIQANRKIAESENERHSSEGEK